MRALTGEATTLGAWRRFFEPGDVVGIKVNAGGVPHVVSSPAIVGRDLPPAAWRSASRASQIVVFERFQNQLDGIDYAAAPPRGGAGLRAGEGQPAHGEPRVRPRDLRRGGLLRRGRHALEHDAPRHAEAHEDRQHPEHEGPRRDRRHGLPEERRLRLLLERGPQPLPRPDPHPHRRSAPSPRSSRCARGRVLQIMDGLRAVWHGGPFAKTTALRVPPAPDPLRDRPGGDRPPAPRRHRREAEGGGRHLDLGPLAEVPEVQRRAGARRRPEREHPDPRAGPRGVRRPASAWASPTSRRSGWRRSRCERSSLLLAAVALALLGRSRSRRRPRSEAGRHRAAVRARRRRPRPGRPPASRVVPSRGEGPRGADAAPAPRASRARAEVASATHRPWLFANGWRFLRKPDGRYWCDVPAGQAALAAAEAFAYGADAVLAIDPAGPRGASAGCWRSSPRCPRLDLPAVADVAVVDDGSPPVGEVLNLMARRNLLFEGRAEGSRPTSPSTSGSARRSSRGRTRRTRRRSPSRCAAA